MAGVQTIRCQACGFSLSLRAPGQTVTLACQSCGALMDATDPGFSLLSSLEKKITIKPAIPLGSRGEIDKILWEVIGFMQRSDPENLYPWREYLLFNPTQGFRWLVEYKGHWSFVSVIRGTPEKKSSNTCQYGENSYQLFNKGVGVVRYVIGEFYWRVTVGESVKVEDYIAPPFVLSCESDVREKIWSQGRYVEASEIRRIFSVEEMPPQRDVGANQPNRYGKNFTFIRKTFWFSVLFFTVVQVYFLFTSLNKKVLDENYVYHARNEKNTWITPSFILTKKSANLGLTLDTKLDNNWLEAEVLLVNEKTQETFLGNMGASYYHGYEAGESWTEGAKKETAFFSSVPQGVYHLVINVEGGVPEPLPLLFDKNSYQIPFRVVLHYDKVGFSHFIFSIVLLLPFFLLYKAIQTGFEKKRWSESDYSPFEDD